MMSTMRVAALAAVFGGAAGSFGCMLYAGRHNDSRILLVLFTVWVLAPFAGLLGAYRASRGWTVFTRGTLYGLMLVLSLASLAVYGRVALRPPKAQAASVFVLVPPASWLLMAIVLPLAAVVSGRRSRQR